MSRRESREIIMKLLYQLEIQKDDRESQVEEALSEYTLPDRERKYIVGTINGVFEHIEEIDKTIESFSMGWPINRISKVDLAILRFATYEIKYNDEIPENISINEAVELAKKYSGAESASFINGILGSVTKSKQLPVDKK